MGKGLLIVIAVVLVVGVMCVGTYNSLAAGREAVAAALSDIDTNLQRRADLIPNLVSTVKGFAAHENEVIDKVTKARAALAGAGTLDEKAAADQQLTEALKGLTVIVENYPELKSDATYVGLMDELAGAENRIAVSRSDYNDKVKTYNQKIVTFPGSLFAGLFGFEKADYFQAAQAAAQVPAVDFGSSQG